MLSDTSDHDELLRGAAEAAIRAPSIFNTQPWRWAVRDGVLELRADRTRQLAVTDPEGRMLTVSCGIALHHALVTLTADGYLPVVDRLPDSGDPDLLARVALAGEIPPAGARLRDAIAERHTDRRPFSDEPVPDAVVDRLRVDVEEQGVYLADLGPRSMVRFQVTAARAGELDENDPAFQTELAEWTHRPAGAGDGITPSVAVPATPRTVPLRSFYPDGGERLLPGPGHDGGARYLVLWTTGDEPADWLAAGEATSAAMLEATASGLAVSPMTDVIEVPASRALLHRVLDHLGEAQMALRVGVPAAPDDTPVSARRGAADVIEG
ncbi:Acg family FMN-binding oxidoreductase [Cryptosporangium sp. NPDC051539]|uniref:Acg family FMN-binding oxidoreductase n=1 Tax=Cryptosporangium sp. NPDC051539 TaxID=3363962 RepID=UPI0037A8BA6A